jgi:hypothetical protein
LIEGKIAWDLLLPSATRMPSRYGVPESAREYGIALVMDEGGFEEMALFYQVGGRRKKEMLKS